MSRYIEEHRGRFGVEPICRTLGVSASAYYQRATGERSERALEDERLVELITTTHARNYFAYGYRRMWKALLRAGEQVSGHENVVLRLLVWSVRVRLGRTGPGALGERMLGRPVCAMGFEPVLFQWPPLRLTRLCREHVSVGVVSPLLSRSGIRDALEVLW